MLSDFLDSSINFDLRGFHMRDVIIVVFLNQQMHVVICFSSVCVLWMFVLPVT